MFGWTAGSYCFVKAKTHTCETMTLDRWDRCWLDARCSITYTLPKFPTSKTVKLTVKNPGPPAYRIRQMHFRH